MTLVALSIGATQAQCAPSCPPGTTSQSESCLTVPSCPPGTRLQFDSCVPASSGAARDAGVDAASNAGGSAGTTPLNDADVMDTADASETQRPDASDDRSCTMASACGPDCVECPKPAHGMATCTESRCGFACDKDYVAKGSECSLGTIYVNVSSGRDDWEGTEARPLKTYRRAIELASANGSAIKTINFAAGTYSEPVDDFSASIPEGVTVQNWGTGSVAFQADPVRPARLAFEAAEA